MTDEVALQAAVVDSCDDYIADARRRLANLIDVTGEGREHHGEHRSAFSLMQTHKALSERGDTFDDDDYDRKFYDWANNRLSTCSYSSVYTNLSLKSAQSAPAVPRRSALRPKLMPDKLGDRSHTSSFRSRNGDKALKERLERLPLDKAVSVQAKRIHSRRVAMNNSKNKSLPARPKRSGSARSSDSNSSQDTPALSDGSSRGRKSSSISSLEDPPTPTEVGSEAYFAYPPKVPTKAASRNSMNCSRRGSYLEGTPKTNRVSFTIRDRDSMFSSPRTASQAYNNLSNSMLVSPTEHKPDEAKSNKRPSLCGQSAPSSRLVAGPEYKHEHEIQRAIVVKDVVSFFDDSSDNEDEDVGGKDKMAKAPRIAKTPAQEPRQITATSNKSKRSPSENKPSSEKNRCSTSESNSENSTIAGGYAHIKEGVICHSPAYMRVSPEAAAKARKALDRRMEAQARETQKQSFLQALLSSLTCGLAEDKANKGSE